MRDCELTDESIYWNRRQVLRALGFAGTALPLLGCDRTTPVLPQQKLAPIACELNPRFANPGRPLTSEELVTTYTNFYEYGIEKERVRERVGDFVVDPWSVEITGLLQKPGRYSVDELEALVQPEERRYRFRCVEAWSMTVPWIGLPLSTLMQKLGVHDDARYVRMTTAHRPAQMPGIDEQPHYPWPYYECLEIGEARCDLTLLATGIYGKRLPKQNGAPLRLVVPWKYGLKSIKSIAKIEFTTVRRGTFWNAVAPDQYSWHSNVDPSVPHVEWSQASERLIDDGRRIPTRPFNGYGRFVAHLYS